MTRFAPFLIFLAMLVCGTPAMAMDVLDEIEKKSASVHSIASNFIQYKHLQIFDEVMVSEGTFHFQKPNSLRWEYTAPFKTGFVLKGAKGLEWDDATGKVRPFTTTDAPHMHIIAEQITAWATFRRDWLSERYEIRQLEQSPVVLELRPKTESARTFLHHLKVTFTDDRNGVSTLEIHEPEGDFTRIEFVGTVINGEMPPETFSAKQ